MEITSLNNNQLSQNSNNQSSIDTSRPFRSVKEAVAAFGDRILIGATASSTPCSPMQAKTTPEPENDNILKALKRVEAELEETKEEVRMVKEKERETEMTMEALKSELQKAIFRLDEATETKREEEKRRELKKRMEKNTTLAQILSLGLGENDHIYNMMSSDSFGKNYSLINAKKVKPIVPLVGDMLSSLRKGSRSEFHHHNALYSPPSI